MSTVSPGEGLFVRLKEAAGHTLVYGLGSAAQTLLGVLLLPLYAHYFTAAEFGVLSLITLVATLAGALFYLGSSSALSRSYYDYESREDRRRTIGTAFALTLAGAAVQVALAFAFSGRLSAMLFGTEAYRPHIVVALVSSAVTFVNGLFLVVLRFERRSAAVVAINIAGLVLTTTAVVGLLFVWRLGLMAPLAGGLIAQAALSVALAWLVRDSLGGAVWGREVRVQLRFGLGAVCIGAAYYVLDAADRLLLNQFVSLTDVGIYSLGYRIGMLIHVVFILPFSQIWTPMRMQYRHDANAGELFTLILTYYWMIGLLATVGIALFAKEIVAVAGAPEYLPAYRVVPIVMLSHLVYGAIGIVDNGIIFTRKVGYQAMIFAVGAALNVGLNLLLIPRYGYMAAAYVTLLSYVVVAAAAFAVANRLAPLRVEHRRVGLLMVSAVGVLLGGAALAEAPPSAGVPFRLLLLAGLAAFWYVGVLSDRERSRLMALRAKFL